MRKLNKKGKATRYLALGLTMFAVVLLSIGALIVGVPFLQEAVPTGADAGDGAGTDDGSSESNFCSNNPRVDLKPRFIDAAQSSATYRNATLYIVNDVTGVMSSYTTDGATSTTDSSRDVLSDALTCGQPHSIYVEANSTDSRIASFIGSTDATEESLLSEKPLVFELSADETTASIVEKDFKVLSQPATLTVRAKDLEQDAFMYNGSSSTDAKAWTTLGGSVGANFTSTTDTTTNTPLNSSDTYNVKYEIKTSTANTVFGVTALFGIDYLSEASGDNNDWSDPSVEVDGISKSDIKGTLSANDQLAWTGYEKVFNIGTTEDTGKDVVVQTTGVDGETVDYDITYKIVGTGVIEDDDSPGNLIGTGGMVGFKTDSSRTELMSQASAFTFTHLID